MFLLPLLYLVEIVQPVLFAFVLAGCSHVFFLLFLPFHIFAGFMKNLRLLIFA